MMMILAKTKQCAMHIVHGCDIHQILDECGGGSRQSGGASLPSNRAKHSLQIAHVVQQSIASEQRKIHSGFM